MNGKGMKAERGEWENISWRIIVGCKDEKEDATSPIDENFWQRSQFFNIPDRGFSFRRRGNKKM